MNRIAEVQYQKVAHFFYLKIMHSFALKTPRYKMQKKKLIFYRGLIKGKLLLTWYKDLVKSFALENWMTRGLNLAEL